MVEIIYKQYLKANWITFRKLICAYRNNFVYAYRNKFFRKLNKTSNNMDFPGGAVVKNLPANAGGTGSSSGPERSHMLQSN